MAVFQSLKRAAAAAAVSIAMAVTTGAGAQAPSPAPPLGTDTPAAASGALVPSPSRMSAMPAPSGAPNSGVPDADFAFLNEAVRRGLAEVALGGLAEEKASDERVKKFGEKMVSEHHDANEELMRIATAKGIDLPTELDKTDQNAVDQLDELSGANFDVAYMSRMVSDHRIDVAKFQKEASTGEDPDIKAAAQAILPVLQEHLKMAESILASIDKAGADNSGGAKP